MLDKYDYIEKLVQDYKAGVNGAAEELIERFTPYLKKFHRMAKEGLMDLHDSDSKCFISLFVKERPLKKAIQSGGYNDNIAMTMYETLTYVQVLCSSIGDDDLWQELVMSLLTLANRYNKQDQRNFCAYLYNSYRYEVYRKILSMTSDPLTFCSEYNYWIDGEPSLKGDDDIHISDDLDTDWMYGETCGPLFSNLTVLQRHIIKLYYYDGYNDRNISTILNISKTIITQQRQKAEKILKALGGDFNGKKENN